MYTWRLTKGECGASVESITEDSWAIGQCDRFDLGCDTDVRHAAYPSSHDGQWFTYHRNSVDSSKCTTFNDPAYEDYITKYFQGVMAFCDSETFIVNGNNVTRGNTTCDSWQHQIPQLVLKGTDGWFYQNVKDPVMHPTVLNNSTQSSSSANNVSHNSNCGWKTEDLNTAYRFTVLSYDNVSTCSNDATNAISQACKYTDGNGGEAYCGKGSWFYDDTCHDYYCQIPLNIAYGSYSADTSCNSILDDSNQFYLLESGSQCGSVTCDNQYTTSATEFICSKGSLTSEPLCGIECDQINLPSNIEGLTCYAGNTLQSATNPTCTVTCASGYSVSSGSGIYTCAATGGAPTTDLVCTENTCTIPSLVLVYKLVRPILVEWVER